MRDCIPHPSTITSVFKLSLLTIKEEKNSRPYKQDIMMAAYDSDSSDSLPPLDLSPPALLRGGARTNVSKSYYSSSDSSDDDEVPGLKLRGGAMRSYLPVLHKACRWRRRANLDRIRDLVEADLNSVLLKSNNGDTPLQLACRHHLSSAIKAYLAEKQVEAIQAQREKCNEGMEPMLFPDLVVAEIWKFSKPDVWQPKEEDLLSEDEVDSDDSAVPGLQERSVNDEDDSDDSDDD